MEPTAAQFGHDVPVDDTPNGDESSDGLYITSPVFVFNCLITTRLPSMFDSVPEYSFHPPAVLFIHEGSNSLLQHGKFEKIISFSYL